MVNGDIILKLESEKAEMLEALIEYIKWGAMTNSDKYIFEQKFKTIIEKSTGLSIEEVLSE